LLKGLISRNERKIKAPDRRRGRGGVVPALSPGLKKEKDKKNKQKINNSHASTNEGHQLGKNKEQQDGKKADTKPKHPGQIADGSHPHANANAKTNNNTADGKKRTTKRQNTPDKSQTGRTHTQSPTQPSDDRQPGKDKRR
jgi:hypothetical protein